MALLSDMGFFEPSVGGRGHFAVIALMIMKLGTGIKLDCILHSGHKKFVTSLLLHNYDVITCILAGR